VAPPKDTKLVTRKPDLTTGFYLVEASAALSRRPPAGGSVPDHEDDDADEVTLLSQSPATC
jgi:hypothetical protein